MKTPRHPTLLALALAALLLPNPSEARTKSRFDASLGLDLPTGLTATVGVNLLDAVSVDGQVSTALLLSRSAAYLNYNLQMENSTLKLGFGPASYAACGHGCGEEIGFAVRAKWNILPKGNEHFGYFLETGYFRGEGDAFAGTVSNIPHVAAGMHWFIY